MSKFDHLDRCPYCRTLLTGYECWKCKVEFVQQGDKLVERWIAERGKAPRPERRCSGCDLPLSRRAEHTAEWEEDNNAEAYVTCRNCGYENPF